MRLDLATYKRHAGRLNLDGIDFDDFRRHPLDPDTRRCLRYMHDVEHHTICYLRELLSTAAHRDPDITEFLSIWVFEELWHGEAIAAVLAAHDEPSGAARIRPMRRALRWKEGLGPLLHGLASAAIGRSYTAVHMAWGAVNEWTTQAGYGRLGARAGHPTLTELLRRIMRQEGRHVDVYASQAWRRLTDDSRARKLTRFALDRFWSPVGSDVMPESEVAFVVRHLFSGDDGRQVVERLDRNIDRLPGLDGLRLVDRAAQRYAA